MKQGAFSSNNPTTIFSFHASAKKTLRSTTSPQSKLSQRLLEAEKKHVARKLSTTKATNATATNSLKPTKNAKSSSSTTHTQSPRVSKQHHMEKELYLKQKLKQELLRKKQLDEALLNATNTLIAKQQKQLKALKKKGISTMNQLEEMIEKEQQKTIPATLPPDTSSPPPNTSNLARREATIHTSALSSPAILMRESTLSLPVVTVRPSFGATPAAMEEESNCDTRSHSRKSRSSSCSSIEHEDMSQESADMNKSREATPELPHEEFFSYPEEDSFCVLNINSSVASGNNGSRLTSLFQSL